jgi:hypothetical protein
MNFEAKIRLIAKMQQDYISLVNSSKLSKKNICDVCIPVRDALGLDDQVTLRIARRQMTLPAIIEIIDSKTVKPIRGANSLSDAEYELLCNLANVTGMNCWFSLAASGPKLYVYDLEENKKRSLVEGISMLVEGLSCELLSSYSDEDKSVFRGLCERLSIDYSALI